MEESRVTLAKLSLLEGHQDVEASLREVLAEARKQKEPEIEAFAQITLAEVLLKSGRSSDAAKEIASAEAAAETSEERLHRIDVFVAAARVHAALHDAPKAERMLTAAIAESNRLRCVRCQLESRLALAELKLKQKDTHARTTITTLRRDASKVGFMFVAQQAASLLANR